MSTKKPYLDPKAKKELITFLLPLVFMIFGFMSYLVYQVNHTKSLLAENVIRTFVLKEYRVTDVDKNISVENSKFFLNVKSKSLDCTTSTNFALSSSTSCTISNTEVHLVDKGHSKIIDKVVATADNINFLIKTKLFDKTKEDIYKSGFKLTISASDISQPKGTISEEYISDIISKIDFHLEARVKKILKNDILVIFKARLSGDNLGISINEKVLVRSYLVPREEFVSNRMDKENNIGVQMSLPYTVHTIDKEVGIYTSTPVQVKDAIYSFYSDWMKTVDDVEKVKLNYKIFAKAQKENINKKDFESMLTKFLKVLLVQSEGTSDETYIIAINNVYNGGNGVCVSHYYKPVLGIPRSGSYYTYLGKVNWKKYLREYSEETEKTVTECTSLSECKLKCSGIN